MIHFSPKAPVETLAKLESVGSLTRYNLFEAPDIGGANAEYEELIGQIQSKFGQQNMTTIVDTGVMQGKSIGLGNIITSAKAVNATHVILPDTPGDLIQTYLTSLGGYHYMQEELCDTNFMFVLQGDNIKEAIGHYSLLVEEFPRIDAVGIPYMMGNAFGSRIPIVLELLQKYNTHPEVTPKLTHIHLLGLNDNYLSDCYGINALLKQFRPSITVGMDSSLPILAAERNIRLDNTVLTYDQRTELISSLRAARDDRWWSGNHQWYELTSQNVENLRHEINTVLVSV